MTTITSKLPIRHDWAFTQGDDWEMAWNFKTGFDLSQASARCQLRPTRDKNATLEATLACAIDGTNVTCRLPAALSSVIDPSTEETKHWYDLEIDNWDGSGDNLTFFYGIVKVYPQVTVPDD